MWSVRRGGSAVLSPGFRPRSALLKMGDKDGDQQMTAPLLEYEDGGGTPHRLHAADRQGGTKKRAVPDEVGLPRSGDSEGTDS